MSSDRPPWTLLAADRRAEQLAAENARLRRHLGEVRESLRLVSSLHTDSGLVVGLAREQYRAERERDEWERALREGLAEQGFEPSGQGTVYDALGAVGALKDARDEARRRLDVERKGAEEAMRDLAVADEERQDAVRAIDDYIRERDAERDRYRHLAGEVEALAAEMSTDECESCSHCVNTFAAKVRALADTAPVEAASDHDPTNCPNGRGTAVCLVDCDRSAEVPSEPTTADPAPVREVWHSTLDDPTARRTAEFQARLDEAPAADPAPVQVPDSTEARCSHSDHDLFTNRRLRCRKPTGHDGLHSMVFADEPAPAPSGEGAALIASTEQEIADELGGDNPAGVEALASQRDMWAETARILARSLDQRPASAADDEHLQAQRPSCGCADADRTYDEMEAHFVEQLAEARQEAERLRGEVTLANEAGKYGTAIAKHMQEQLDALRTEVRSVANDIDAAVLPFGVGYVAGTFMQREAAVFVQRLRRAAGIGGQ